MNRIITFCTTVLVLSIFMMSCSSEQDGYHDIPGYNGRIKQITTYSYLSDVEKTRVEAQVGSLIPTDIRQYNERGLLSGDLDVFCDYEDDEAGISIRRFDYDSHDNVTMRVSQRLTCSILQALELVSPFIEGGDIVFVENASTDTVLTHNTYEGNLLIEADGGNHIERFSYDGTKKTSYTRIWDGDTTFIEYKYIDGVLREESSLNDMVIKYDELGREIYWHSPHRETVKTYKDSLVVSSTVFKGSYSASLTRNASLLRDIEVIVVSCGDSERNHRSALGMLERYRDGKITLDELDQLLKSLVLEDDRVTYSTDKTEILSVDDKQNPTLLHNSVIDVKNRRDGIPIPYKYYLDPEIRSSYYENTKAVDYLYYPSRP